MKDVVNEYNDAHKEREKDAQAKTKAKQERNQEKYMARVNRRFSEQSKRIYPAGITKLNASNVYRYGPKPEYSSIEKNNILSKMEQLNN